jgi:transcriptional regulator with XRE-family HTH domain
MSYSYKNSDKIRKNGGKMKSKELCIYLERLRSARNISQEEFTHGVVSLRQYRRYLNGESDLPFQVIDKLTAKIGVKTDNLLREFEIAKIEETKLINNLFNLAANYAYDEFSKLSQTISLDHIIEKTNQLMYQHSITLNDFYTKKISNTEFYQINTGLINYPKMLTQQIITSVEMLILTSLIDASPPQEQLKILEKINEFINDSTIVISGANEKIFTFTLAKIAKYFGIQENFKEVIKFSNMGIERNFSLKSYYLMEYFYYYNALAYYRIGEFDDYSKMIVKCFNVLHFEGNDKKIEKFTKLIEEDFKIHFQDFVLNYYKNNSNNE